ncbi:arginyltransferase [Kangiella sediminilitoris]|uniref:Aspartate/glutamate leucyltransferase n=1 Tax=Kangiella sediminilitoris TaxID=1144748 RepID=A0A1B3BAB4_9GAMM|nr:arginyltransferase [Kangiella sediminilitoris]AOE49749.1 Putative arginyl-tRNA--protein transferase [Kangiella sediminilitoris]
MSNKEKTTQHIRLFKGPEHACGYLDNKIAVSVFADPSLLLSSELYSELSRQGFRRSGEHVYRPHCPGCSACWAYRVLTEHFKPSKSQRRVLRNNRHLSVSMAPPEFKEEDYQLYEDYIKIRHRDGDMFPPSKRQYTDFLFSDWCDTILLKVRDEEKLVAVICLDVLDDGLSAVYSFFDTSSQYSSLGVFIILKSIEYCQRMYLPYCYLGYYVKGCQKMNYKVKYKPAEVFRNKRWLSLD